MATTTTTSFIKIHHPIKCSTIRFITLNPNSRHLKPPRKPPRIPAPSAKNVALATTVFSTLTSSPLAMAAKKIAESPNEDNRVLALLLPIIPAVAWVLYNILGPAINQINRMRSEKGIVVGLGLGLSGLVAVSLPSSSFASEVVENGGEYSSGGNSRGLLVLLVAVVAFFEVLLLSTSMKSESKDKEMS